MKDAKRALVFGHRGASARYPENTFKGLWAALVEPPQADGIECDVRLSADHVPVLFHDDDTYRLTGQPGAIEKRTLAEIQSLRVADQPIPTLELLAQRLTEPNPERQRPIWLNVELKPTNAPLPLIEASHEVLTALDEAPFVELIVSSFDPRVIKTVFDMGFPWSMALIYEALEALRFVAMLDELGHLDLHPDHRLVDAAHLNAYRTSPHSGNSRRFRAWTVDSPERAQELVDMGIEAVITNRPQHIKEKL